MLSPFPPAAAVGVQVSVSGSKNTSMTRNGCWVARGLRGLYSGAGRIERPLVAQPDGVASSFALPALVAAGVLSPAHGHRYAIRPVCMCVSSCWEVAEAGRGDGVRRTSHLARREFGRDGTLADGAHDFHSSFTRGKCRQAWPLDCSTASPHSARCSSQLRRRAASYLKNLHRTAPDPIGLCAFVSQSM